MILTMTANENLKGVPILISTCLFLAVSGTYLNFNRDDAIAREISRNETRLSEVRKIFPERGTIGYLTSLDGEQLTALGNSKTLTELFMFRYILAPLIIVDGVPQDVEFAIGNFSHGTPKNLHSTSFEIIRRFPNGIVILKRRNP